MQGRTRENSYVKDTAKDARCKRNSQTCQSNAYLYRKPMEKKQSVMEKCFLCQRPLRCMLSKMLYIGSKYTQIAIDFSSLMLACC